MAQAAAVRSDPSKSADVVMVACKLPHGIVLELVEPGTMVNADGKPIQSLRPNPKGHRVILKGANSLREDKRAAQGAFPYALTPVDRSFWEAWLKRNSELEFVKKGFVFSADSAADAKAEGKERQDERTGLEALQVDKDPRLALASRAGTNVETDKDSLERAMAAPT